MDSLIIINADRFGEWCRRNLKKELIPWPWSSQRWCSCCWPWQQWTMVAVVMLVRVRVADDDDITMTQMAKCTFHKYGPTGTIQRHDGLCILPVGTNHLHLQKYFIGIMLIVLTWFSGEHHQWEDLLLPLVLVRRPRHHHCCSTGLNHLMPCHRFTLCKQHNLHN